jgi:hypothetical protein
MRFPDACRQLSVIADAVSSRGFTYVQRVRWVGQEPLEAALSDLVAAGKRRELAAACIELATLGAAVEVRGLDGPLDVLQRWLIGGQADIAAAVEAADGIATHEYNEYAATLDGAPINYAQTARAIVVWIGCRFALAQSVDLEQLAYNALSSIAGGAAPTDEHIALAVDAVHAA